MVLCITLFSLQGQSFESTHDLSNDSTKLDTIYHSSLSKGFEKVKIPLIRKGSEKQFWVLPAAAWNNYDKTLVGFILGVQKEAQYDLFIAPLYGIGSGNLTGLIKGAYRFKTPRINEWEVGLKARRFSYLLFPEDLTFNTIKPSLHISPNENIKGKFRFGITSTYAWQEFLLNGRQTERFNLQNIDADYTIKENKYSLSTKLIFEFNRNFGNIHWTNDLIIPILAHPDNEVQIKSFVGGFLYNTKASSNINPPLPVFQLSGLSNTSIYWLQKDYGFNDWYLDRNAQDNFLRKQVASSEGGFFSPTSAGNSTNFMAALNLQTDVLIPARIKKWLNFQIFANGAVVKNKGLEADIYAETGASILLFNEVIGFHLPFTTTNNIKENQQTLFNIESKDWTKRISFSIDFLQLEKLAKE